MLQIFAEALTFLRTEDENIGHRWHADAGVDSLNPTIAVPREAAMQADGSVDRMMPVGTRPKAIDERQLPLRKKFSFVHVISN